MLKNTIQGTNFHVYIQPEKRTLAHGCIVTIAQAIDRGDSDDVVELLIDHLLNRYTAVELSYPEVEA